MARRERGESAVSAGPMGLDDDYSYSTLLSAAGIGSEPAVGRRSGGGGSSSSSSSMAIEAAASSAKAAAAVGNGNKDASVQNLDMARYAALKASRYLQQQVGFEDNECLVLRKV